VKFASKAIKYHKKAVKEPATHDPVMTKYRPDRYFGCVSEEFSSRLETFLASDEAKAAMTNGECIGALAIVIAFTLPFLPQNSPHHASMRNH